MLLGKYSVICRITYIFKKNVRSVSELKYAHIYRNIGTLNLN